MSIKDLFHGAIVSVQEGTLLKDVAELMDARCVGFVVVTSQNATMNPIGVITDRDIVVSGIAKGLDMQTTKVEAVMTSQLVTAHPDAEISEVIALMEGKNVRRILLVDSSGCACGVVSSDDLIKLLGSELSKIADLCSGQIGTSRRHHANDFTRMA